MFGTPLTLLTGFGWEAYWTFPFRWVTHNHYLQQWFNLGLVGLICSVLLFVVPIRTVNAAANYADPDVRPMLIAFGIGTIARRDGGVLRQSVFALALLLVVCGHRHAPCRERTRAAGPCAAAVTAPAPRRGERLRDPHGWTAAS